MSALAELLHVGLRCGMLPHVRIHGGGKHYLACEGEIKRREKVVAIPCAKLASRLAVAGATTRNSLSCATRMCSTALLKTPSPEPSCQPKGQ